MSNEICTVEDIQKIPIGHLSISIKNGSEKWEINDLPSRFSEKIHGLINYLVEKEIAGSLLLRHMVITSDVPKEVIYWANQLGEFWRVSTEGVNGQTLTWGDGKPESTFSIIILSQDIALDLVTNGHALHNQSYCTVIHELAHVHDDCLYLARIGRKPIPNVGGWLNLRQFYAMSMWGEYFAESTAAPFIDNSYIALYFDDCVKKLKETIEDIRQETIAFQSHRVSGKVWEIATRRLSTIFNSLGRAIALIVFYRGNELSLDNVNLFLNQIAIESGQWRKLTEHFLSVLENSQLDLTEKLLSQIGDIVDDCFRSVGLEPYKIL